MRKKVSPRHSSRLGPQPYTTILNCNVILENLATQQGILSPAETNLMKGELLALRAFLHFDMLRLFGPIYKEDPSALSIPYNESVKIMNLPLLPADSIVHNKIMRDLDEAEKLLAKDPVIPEGLWPPLWKMKTRYICVTANYG